MERHLTEQRGRGGCIGGRQIIGPTQTTDCIHTYTQCTALQGLSSFCLLTRGMTFDIKVYRFVFFCFCAEKSFH